MREAVQGNPAALMVDGVAFGLSAAGQADEAVPLLGDTVYLSALVKAYRQVGDVAPVYDSVAARLVTRISGDLRLLAGSCDEAEQFYQKAIAIDETASNVNPSQAEEHLSALADLYDDQGRGPDAAPLLRRALSILETAGVPNKEDKEAARFLALQKETLRFLLASRSFLKPKGCVEDSNHERAG